MVQFEPETSWSSCKNIFNWASRAGHTLTMWSAGAPIDVVQLSMTYQIASGQITYQDFQKEIQRFPRLPLTDKRFKNLFPFENCGYLRRRLGTS